MNAPRENVTSFNPEKQNGFPLNEIIMPLKTIVLVGGFAAIIAGIGGMVFCLTFLYSAQMEDLVAAGFPFVGGAILAGSGLITLAIALRSAKGEKITIEN